MIFVAACVVPIAWAWSAYGEDWEAQLATAQRTYNLSAAEQVVGAMRGRDVPPMLRARARLLVGELQRILYEDLPAEAWSRRRELGNAIDEAAEAGLHAIEDQPDASEVWRIRADLYGLMIRTDFQATKYRSRMIDAADQAIALDAANPRAYITRAKPYLFAEPGRGQDLDEAVRLLDQALALDPNLESALLLKAFAHHQRGEMPAALALVEHVLRTNPDCSPAIRWREKWSKAQ
jgi:tetratricopeptide (TPR) repeat protein